MEDDLCWKTTFGETFGGGRPSGEDDFWWKTTFSGRRPLVEDDLRWKTTFSGRRPAMEDDPLWKTTFNGRRLPIEIFRDSALPYTAVAVIFAVAGGNPQNEGFYSASAA